MTMPNLKRRRSDVSQVGSLDDYNHNPESDPLTVAKAMNRSNPPPYYDDAKKNPDNPNHNGPIDIDKWKSTRPAEPTGGLTRGQVVRTHDGREEGKVIRTLRGHVFFKTKDGREISEPINNVITVEKLEDQDTEMFETVNLNEISNEVLARYKTAAGKDIDAKMAAAKDEYSPSKGAKLRGAAADRFGNINKATIKQFSNSWPNKKKKTDEGGMGGINRCAPANDVSYEKVLDEVQSKWIEEGKLSGKGTTGPALSNVKKSRKGPALSAKGTTLGEDWKDIPDTLPPVDPKNKIDPWKGKPDKLAKAPVSSMSGTLETVFSELVKDSIDTHGVKWAFEYYVKKHGLPPRQFRIFAGI